MRLLAFLLMTPAIALASDTSSSSLDWLEGCWVSDDGSSREIWVVEDEESLIGFGITLDGASLRSYEVLRIRLREDGSWSYHAHPSGQASTVFVTVELAERRVTFSNPDHDYPQEVHYRRDGDRLYASISLSGGAEPRSFDKRACE